MYCITHATKQIWYQENTCLGVMWNHITTYLSQLNSISHMPLLLCILVSMYPHQVNKVTYCIIVNCKALYALKCQE